jgi:hypothetical protein
MVRILDPHEGETIYDPACGTGGMLIEAIHHDQAYSRFAENHRFQIPEEAHWKTVRKASKNVGAKLQDALRAIETTNPDKLFGIFGDAQWTNKERLPDDTLKELIEHFSSLTLCCGDAVGLGLGHHEVPTVEQNRFAACCLGVLECLERARELDRFEGDGFHGGLRGSQRLRNERKRLGFGAHGHAAFANDANQSDFNRPVPAFLEAVLRRDLRVTLLELRIRPVVHGLRSAARRANRFQFTGRHFHGRHGSSPVVVGSSSSMNIRTVTSTGAWNPARFA